MAILAVTLILSCKKHAATVREKPGIEIKEIGLDNSGIAYTNNELHLDARLTAAGRIAEIKVQITLAETNYGWDFVKTYTSYAGLKDAHFHEHIAVPENARPGKYSLLMVVTDQAGEKTQVKANFEIVRDLSLPRITNAFLDTSNTSMLRFSGLVEATKGISGLIIEVQSSAWTRTVTDTNPAMVDQTRFQLIKDIDLSTAPGGHYHVNISVIDKTGKQAVYAYHFDK